MARNLRPPIDRIQPGGELIVGITPDYKMLHIQFQDPDWFVEFTPAQARNLARILLAKAEDIDQHSAQAEAWGG